MLRLYVRALLLMMVSPLFVMVPPRIGVVQYGTSLNHVTTISEGTLANCGGSSTTTITIREGMTTIHTLLYIIILVQPLLQTTHL